MDTRVFWSVLCALLVFSGLVWFVFAVIYSMQVKQANEAVSSLVSSMHDSADKARAAAAQRRRNRALAKRREIASRTLSDAQECRGHTVVDVSGSSYVQHLGADGRPVKCTGRLAVAPLR